MISTFHGLEVARRGLTLSKQPSIQLGTILRMQIPQGLQDNGLILKKQAHFRRHRLIAHKSQDNSELVLSGVFNESGIVLQMISIAEKVVSLAIGVQKSDIKFNGRPL